MSYSGEHVPLCSSGGGGGGGKVHICVIQTD